MTLTADVEATLVDRFTFAAIAESGRLLDEGIATAKDIDLAMRAGAGFAMGPLELADTIGLDAILEKLNALHAKFGENFAASATLQKLVAAGALGKKTGRGFLEYK